MKRYYSIFLLSFFLGACQDSLKEGFGYLQFSSVELNKTVIPTSKATGETTEKIALDLIRDGDRVGYAHSRVAGSPHTHIIYRWWHTVAIITGCIATAVCPLEQV